MPTLLLIDDDTEVLKINSKFLTEEGFKVYATNNPIKGIAIAQNEEPDCILLDVMMPKMDGYEVCNKIRSFSNVPIIFLTGKSSEDDKINGLMMGGDDYILKPYSLKELLARIQVILRRISQLKTTETTDMVFGDLKIDPLAHKAFYQGEDLLLSNREYDVLYYMASHPNEDVTFEAIGTALFGSYMESDRRQVMVNMSRLRKKMSFDVHLGNMIETVWSKGYRFIAK